MKSIKTKLPSLGRAGFTKVAILVMMLVSSFITNAQTQAVSGIVTDASNGATLPSVNILVKGTSTGIVTDMDGKYSIDVNENATLVFSFIGYSTQEIVVGKNQKIDVVLETETEGLDEVIIVGYGIQKKSLVTGAISSIKGDDLANTSQARVESMLQGRTAGVSLAPSSGAPGADVKIRIRGAGSNGNSNPLFIIDGMKTSDASFLESSDIESIEILKDAASSAIYGSEGANGVIIITTKTGKKGDGLITYNFQYGSQSAPTMPKMMNKDQYLKWMTEIGEPIGANIIKPADQGTQWLDEIFTNAPMKKHNLTFSGGSEKSSYLLSLSYLDQDGILGGESSNFSRYTIRLNSDTQLKDWLKVGTNITFAHTKSSSIAEDNEYGSIVGSALVMDPLTPVYYDGALPGHAQAVLDQGNTLRKNKDGKYYGVSQIVGAEMGNPLAMIDIQTDRNYNNRTFGNFYADLTPIKNLKVTSRLGFNYTNGNDHSWTPKYYWSGERYNNSLAKSDDFNMSYSWSFENFAAYTLQQKNHNLVLLGGISYEEGWNKYVTTQSAGMLNESENNAYHGNAEIEGFVSGELSKTKLASYFGRLSYDYSNRYMLEATVRRDGTSMLAESKRWGVFPSVSAGWVVSEESFFSKKAISYMKIRGSWGQNGSIANLSPDQYKAVVTDTGIAYPIVGGGFYNGAEVQVGSNNDLTWETSEQIDLGLDLKFLEGKLSFSADYFKKTTKDLIVAGTVPLSAGIFAPQINGGDVVNKGFEFEASYRNNIGDFKYSISANATTLKNEVTYLNGVERLPGLQVGSAGHLTWFEEGHPLWYFRGYKTDGIFQNDAEVAAYTSKYEIDRTPLPGEPIVVDTNNDMMINDNDKTEIGDPHAKFLYGFNLNFEYKGFDFGLFAQGQSGADVFMSMNRTDRPNFNRPAFFFEDRWTGAGSTNSWFKADYSNNYIYESDLMVFNASFLKIKQIQLGYTFPKDLANKVFMQKARIYLSLDDYFTFTKYKGMDPEAGSMENNGLGVDRGFYPGARKVMFGISLTF